MKGLLEYCIQNTPIFTLYNRLACPRSRAQTKKGISGDSVPTTNSVDLLRVLAIACEVTTDGLPDFVHQLAEGHGGLSLEYMYHRDALRSGTSYQNSGHIHLKDNCQVGTPSPLSSPYYPSSPISFSLLFTPFFFLVLFIKTLLYILLECVAIYYH